MNDSPPKRPEWLSLTDDERVWLRLSPSRNLVLASLTVGFGLLLVMSVGVSATSDLATGRLVSFVVLVLIVGLLVLAFLVIRRYEYVLTDERVCSGVGLRSKRVAEVPLAEVREVTVEQSRWQGLLDIGNLLFVTDDDRLTFLLIENPRRVHQTTLQFVDDGDGTVDR